MKKMFVLSMLISFAMICSCQKQDSAAEQQLAQRRAEVDAREKALDERVNALDERMNALDERVKALAEKEKATANARTIPTGVQGQIPDPAQANAERDRIIQQFRAQIQARIPDDSKMKAKSDSEKQERPAQRQPGLEEFQRQRQRWGGMFGAAGSPAVEAASPTPSPTPQ